MKTNRNAFTLVELLVVITIIGILAAIAIPALQQGQVAANLTSCSKRMKQIFSGIQSYRASNQSNPPTTGGEEATNWAMYLKDNGKGAGSQDNELFFCPFTGRKATASDDGDFMYNLQSEGLSALSSAAPTDLPLIADCVKQKSKDKFVSNHGKLADQPINVQLKDGSTQRAGKQSDLFKRTMKQNMVGGANTANMNCPPPAGSSTSSSSGGSQGNSSSTN